MNIYVGLLHSHQTFALLFLLHYAAKLILLLLNRQAHLERYSKAMRIPEIVLSVGFLLTGVSMFIMGAVFTPFMIIKLVCVFASIPLAVIGFKKKNKALAFIAVFLIVMSYGLAEMNKKAKTGKKIDTSAISDPMVAGKLIYTNKCAQCHGEIGNGGKNGAKDLSLSQMSAEEQKQIVRNGKNSMPGFKEDVLSDKDLEALVNYISTLKQ